MPVQRLDVAAMGGNVHAILIDPVPGAEALVRGRLAELEQRWSRFRADSELSRLNAAGGEPTPVSPDTERLVRLAVRAWQSTGGAFDPSVHDALVGLGYDRDFAAGPSRDSDYRPRPAPGCAGIEIAPGSIQLPAGVRLDPGGLGKGLAADLITAELLALGCAGACLNVAGDLRVRGAGPDGPGWRIGIDDPHDHRRLLLELTLDDGGCATSSVRGRQWGAGRHHLIDPSTGLPLAGELVAVTVLAPDAAVAEALTKAVLVRGLPATEAMLTELDAVAVAVGGGDRILLSQRWPASELLA